ncbi:colicin uptake protein TolQ [compost metagenome]
MSILLQVDSLAVTQESLAETVPVEKTLSIIELLTSGGLAGQLIMTSLFLMFFVALYLYFERLMAINSASKIDVNFMGQIRENIRNGRIDNAKMACGKPLDDINTAIENAGKLEIYKLEKNVSMLATISGAGPMTGFLGTVVGMVQAFHKMASSGGQIEVGALSEGIYTAMTTTVVGLVVGIIAYVGYNHLVVKTDKIVHQMEANAVDFLDLLNDPA